MTPEEDAQFRKLLAGLLDLYGVKKAALFAEMGPADARIVQLNCDPRDLVYMGFKLVEYGTTGKTT